jgi:hypothetical protein
LLKQLAMAATLVEKKTRSADYNGANVTKLTTINNNSTEQFLLYVPFHEYQASH